MGSGGMEGKGICNESSFIDRNKIWWRFVYEVVFGGCDIIIDWVVFICTFLFKLLSPFEMEIFLCVVVHVPFCIISFIGIGICL